MHLHQYSYNFLSFDKSGRDKSNAKIVIFFIFEMCFLTIAQDENYCKIRNWIRCIFYFGNYISEFFLSVPKCKEW